MRAFYSLLLISLALFGLKVLGLHAFYNNNEMEKFRAAVVESGYDVDQENEFGQSVLHLATMHEKLDWITMLLALKANIDKEDSRHHWSPIVWAMSAGKYQSFKLLKEKGAKMVKPTMNYFE